MNTPEPVDETPVGNVEQRGGDTPTDYVKPLPPTERELMEAETGAFMPPRDDEDE